MQTIATISAKDRKDLFKNTAHKMGMHEAIIEKDFWVCWTLDYLFHRCRWKENLVFKGGTSLSKAYALIKRFSEDIDLILDWRVLGYAKDEPWLTRSNTQQDIFNKEANARAAVFLDSHFMTEIPRDFSDELGQPANLKIDADGQTVLFRYPQLFSNMEIQQYIRLEIGALASWAPASVMEIRPYAADMYEHLFKQPSTTVLTVLPERTFWEKVTILHREAHRAPDSAFPQRYSRHYYDLYCMTAPGIDLKYDFALLENVVAFKSKFYRCAWAGYEEAIQGALRLIPHESHMAALRDDYATMKSMFFGDAPSFENLLDAIKSLQENINNMSRHSLSTISGDMADYE